MFIENIKKTGLYIPAFLAFYFSLQLERAGIKLVVLALKLQ